MREIINESTRYCTLDPSDLRRWSLVSAAWQKYQPMLEDGNFYDPNHESELLDMVCSRIHNWPSFGENRDPSLKGFIQEFGMWLLTFMIVSSLYGGIHLLAWNAPFLTPFQRVYWRASSLVIVFSGPTFGCFAAFFNNRTFAHFWQQKRVDAKMLEMVKYLTADFLLMFFWIISFPLVMVYIPSRIYLIVECFLQLSRLPPAAYEVPQWSQYFPHIS